MNLPENGKLGASQDEVPYLILGDEAFPLKPWLMRPFPGKNLDLQKRVFNYRLSRARRIVENAFGIWAARWRILHSVMDCDNDLCHLIIKSTLILHNFLRTVADNQFTEDRDRPDGSVEVGNWRGDEDMSEHSIPRLGSNNYSSQASSIRDLFTDYFMSHEGSLPHQENYVLRN